jgi:drug/metabolite transporter (DMT)-like permease
MTGASLVWLGGAGMMFLTASALLRSYIETDRLAALLVALVLYTAGNLMMVRLMRDGGMAVAISVSAVLQLVLANAVAMGVFGERPGGTQAAGILLGVVAVALILWPGRP